MMNEAMKDVSKEDVEKVNADFGVLIEKGETAVAEAVAANEGEGDGMEVDEL